MAQPIPGPLLYEEGRSSSGAREFFGNMPLDLPINPDSVCFMDDFTMLHGKALNQTDMYDVVKDSSASIAMTDAHGGVVVLTSAATTDNDGVLLQCTTQLVKLQSNKKLWFEARYQTSDADDSDNFVGLAKQAATNPEAVVVAGLARIGFQINEGDASILFVSDNGTVTTSTDTGIDASDATDVVLGFHYNGSKIDVYVNRMKVLSGLTPTVVVGTDLLSPACFHLSGNATGTHTGKLDYLMMVAER